MQVLYFGDQSVDPLNSIEDLLRESKTSLILPQCLHSALEALHLATSTLAPSTKSLFLGRDFSQLVEHIRVKEIRHAAVSSVIHCVAQLGWTIL